MPESSYGHSPCGYGKSLTLKPPHGLALPLSLGARLRVPAPHGISYVAVMQIAVAQLSQPCLVPGRGYLVQTAPALDLRSGQTAVLPRQQSSARRAGAILLDVSGQVVVSRPLVHHRPPYLRRSSRSSAKP